VRKDDPSLNVRHVHGKNPAVVILDPDLRVSPRSRVFRVRRGAPVWVYSRKTKKKISGAQIIEVAGRGDLLNLRAVCRDLLKKGVYSLLVEGGSAVIGSLLRAKMIDRLDLHLAPRLLGAGGVPLGDWRGPKKVAAAPRLCDVEWRRRGDDMCCSGRIIWGKA
jgi:riboflavin-specific deaminase-like protein